MNSTKLILLELNEVNFEYVRHYTERGELPVFAQLLAEHGCTTTHSEQVYEHIEPWIQWVSVHTGKSYAEHGVFRLGDAPATGHEQIWETLEKRGLKVGAFSPMNAGNTLRNPAFFVPDPWTVAPVAGPGVLKCLYAAVAQAVNDNAQARITPRSAIDLIAGFFFMRIGASCLPTLQMCCVRRAHTGPRRSFSTACLQTAFSSCVGRRSPTSRHCSSTVRRTCNTITFSIPAPIRGRTVT
ncbi:MAG: hypothetical protein EXR85_07855, partial [Xanthomonadales bacterium]|nr:hypothetical protein [Xanthomonadales bacterium]